MNSKISLACSMCSLHQRQSAAAGSGSVEPRPGVIRLYEEAREAGLKVAVCSAATKSSVILVLENLLGPERFKVLAQNVPHK